MGDYLKKIDSMDEFDASTLSYPGIVFCHDSMSLKFYPYGVPDKKYAPSEFSGLGVKYLQKNVVDGVNVLAQTMFSSTNTIYVVEYDYVLNTGITIPNNCVLSFKGGSISGGSITLQKTYIDGDSTFIGTVISGSCSNEVLTPLMFGAKPALVETESNKVNHTIGFKNLANVINDADTVSKLIYIPSGHYAINEKIMFVASCEVHGCGETTIIDCYDGAGTIYFGYTSSASHYYDTCEQLNCTITEDANKFDEYITVNNTSELNVDDNIIITDSNDYSFNSSRAYYRTSEFNKIIKIENNKVYLANKLYGYYFADFGEDYVTTLSPAPSHRTIISKFSPKQYILSDFSIISHAHNNVTPSAYYTFIIVGFKDSSFRNINVENYGNQVPWCIKLGMNYFVEGCVVRNYATYTTDAYGLVINNSQDFNVRNSKFSAPSHALATGGANSPFDTNNRNFIYEKLYFEYNNNNVESTSSHGKVELDVHGNAEYYKFLNIISPSSICDCGGYNVTIDNCKLYNISVAFNESDVTIRNCEIFADSTNALVWNEHTRYNLSNNSIIFDNCKLNGSLTINYQNSPTAYDNFIFKNNVCGSLQLRNGNVKNIIIENNSFKEDSRLSSANMIMSNLSIKHNTFIDGEMQIVSHNKGTCIITDNFITQNSAHGSEVNTQTVLLGGLDGYFTNNIIIRNIANYHTPIMVDNSEMKINNNIIKLADNGRNKELVQSNNSFVILGNNMHNSTRGSLIKIGEGSTSATSFGFSDYYSDLSVDNIDRMSIKSAVGSTFYNEKTNKLGYGSISVGGACMTSFTAVGNTYIAENIFKSGQYYFTFSGAYGNHELYLSKYNDVTDPNFESGLTLIHSFSSPLKSFQAPIDANDYPYFHIKSSRESALVRIYPSKAACEYDGAIFNVKRSGTTAERPNGYEIYVGFMYIDTDLNKPIYAKKISGTNYAVTWIDASGATV